MRINVASRACALLCLVVIGACSSDTAVTSAPATRPVKLFLVEGGAASSIRSFPGRVDAAQRAELAFRVSGVLQEVLVKEGDLVIPGQELARLDPTDYLIALEDREATHDNAKRNFERGKELIEDGNISGLDYDRMEANFRTAAAALNLARQELAYTILTSPFRGLIAQRNAENFEEIVAKQPVFFLQNVEQLDVVIDMPETLVRSFNINLREHTEPEEYTTKRNLGAWARFEGRPDARFVLSPKELATKADPQTQTFAATFTMDAPDNFAVLPGMTVTVDMDFSGLLDNAAVKWVPLRAVQADSGLQPQVWVLEPETMTVHARPVVTGRMSSNLIEVKSGLEGGEEIVAVGAPFLAEGMTVSRMPVSEQAVPRADEPR